MRVQASGGLGRIRGLDHGTSPRRGKSVAQFPPQLRHLFAQFFSVIILIINGQSFEKRHDNRLFAPMAKKRLFGLFVIVGVTLTAIAVEFHGIPVP